MTLCGDEMIVKMLGRLFSALARNILFVGDTNSNDLFLGMIEKIKNMKCIG